MAENESISNPDIIVDIGYVGDWGPCGDPNADNQPTKITYNVSTFFTDYEQLGSKWHEKLNSFFRKIDDKVRIDTNDEEHKVVLDGMDNIIEKICEELHKKGLDIKQKLKTGSLYAGLRVGRPYEADVLLEMEEWFKDYSGEVRVYELHKYIMEIVQLVEFKDWILFDVKKHMAGICVSLIYCGDGAVKNQSGIQIDLIPIHSNSNTSGINERELSVDAQKYINSIKFDIDMHKYEANHTFKDFEFDTGFLEHQILENLSDEQKRGIRMAKYLLQSQLVRTEACYCRDDLHDIFVRNNHLTGDQLRNLFGYKTAVASHILQVLFLQLLMKIHGTSLADKISGASLTLCLLDMLYASAHDRASFKSRKVRLVLYDALIRDRTEVFSYPYNGFDDISYRVMRALQILSCKLFAHASMEESGLSFYQLVNHPNEISSAFDFLYRNHVKVFDNDVFDALFFISDSKFDKLKFVGFCRGPSPEDIAEAYDCTKHLKFKRSDYEQAGGQIKPSVFKYDDHVLKEGL